MITIRQRPLADSRTAENNCAWLAETEISGQHYEAKSRRGAPHELARILLAARVPDQPVSVESAGLCGEMRYPSLHRMAGWTYTEGQTTVLSRARYREDERFVVAAAERVILPGNAHPEAPKNALQQPAGIMSPERSCAHCSASFVPSRSWSLHCSPKCRVSAHRAKQSADKNALQPAAETPEAAA